MIDRASWLVLALAGLAIVLTARSLSPSPSGFGTHQALGLPPCGFLLYFERPCPGCGLTTAFAHLARFELVAAIRANAAGVYLFSLNLVMVGVGLFGALRGLRFTALLEARLTRYASALTLLAVFGGWLINLFLWDAA